MELARSSSAFGDWRSWRRKLYAMTTVLGHRVPVEQHDLARELQASYQGLDAWNTRQRLERLPHLLWRTERLGVAYLLPRVATESEPLLRSPAWPRAALPMLHTSLGLAVTLERQFDVDGMLDQIRRHSHPDFAFMAYEGTGALLPATENHRLATLMRLLHYLGRVHWPRSKPLRRLADFPAPVRPYVAHGYGRARYFTHARLPKILDGFRELSPLQAAAARQGVGMAHLMVNADRAHQVLRLGLRLPFRAPLVEIKNGLRSALAFLRWVSAGATTPGEALFGLRLPASESA